MQVASASTPDSFVHHIPAHIAPPPQKKPTPQPQVFLITSFFKKGGPVRITV